MACKLIIAAFMLVVAITLSRGQEVCTDTWGDQCLHFEGLGLCETDLIVKGNCRRTCGICQPQTCTDDYGDKCANLASNEFCTKVPSFMNKYCRKSCGLCSTPSPTV